MTYNPEQNKPHYIVAFEIGSSKVRGAVGIVDNSGIVEVVATEEERILDQVRYGCIQNLEVSNAILTVAERLEAYPRIEPRRIVGAYVGLGGRSIRSRIVDVSLTLPAETEITRPIINELVQKAAATVDAERDVVDVVPVRFTVDNKTQTRPVGSYGRFVSSRMTVVSCIPQIKRMLRRVITERAGIKINGFVNRTLAEAEMVLTAEERQIGCMLVDFGAETTSVAIFKDGSPLYVVTLPMGSRNITLDLTALNKTEERAEELKKACGNAMPQEDARRRHSGAYDDIDTTEINNYVHDRADEIVTNITAQIGYAGMSHTDLAGGIVIVGGGARLRGFNELLSKQSNLRVRQGAPTASVRISDGSIHGTEAIDVISILVDAAKMPFAECVTPLPEPSEEKEKKTRSGDTYGSEDGDDSGESRIGKLDSDFDGDDSHPQKKPKEKKTKESNPEKESKSLLNSIKTRIFRMMDAAENEEDEE